MSKLSKPINLGDDVFEDFISKTCGINEVPIVSSIYSSVNLYEELRDVRVDIFNSVWVSVCVRVRDSILYSSFDLAYYKDLT